MLFILRTYHIAPERHVTVYPILIGLPAVVRVFATIFKRLPTLIYQLPSLLSRITSGTFSPVLFYKYL